MSHPAVTHGNQGAGDGTPAGCSADLTMRHLANRSKHLDVSRSSKDTSLITQAVRNGIRPGKLPLFDCLNKCVRSEGAI